MHRSAMARYNDTGYGQFKVPRSRPSYSTSRGEIEPIGLKSGTVGRQVTDSLGQFNWGIRSNV